MSFSQVQDYGFTRYPADTIPARSDITAIAQDSFGYMWLASGRSLFRLEGNGYTHYQHDPRDSHSLSPGTVTQLYTDRRGWLWIGTDSGVCRYDAGSDSFIRYLSGYGGLTASSDEVITRIWEEEGVLIVAADTDYHYEPAEDSFSAVVRSETAVPDVSTLTDSGGNSWIGTDNGLLYREKGSENEKRFTSISSNGLSLPSNRIRAVFEDEGKNIWVGTSSGTAVYNPQRSAVRSGFTDYTIEALYQDREGTLWTGTRSHGLFRHSPGDNAPVHYIQSEEGTATGSEGLSNNRVKCITGDDAGHIWIGTSDGLNELTIGTGEFRSFFPVPGDSFSLRARVINDLYWSRDGFLWIATDRGLFKRISSRGMFRSFISNPSHPSYMGEDIEIVSILEDSKGILWLSTPNHGFLRFDPESEAVTGYSYLENDDDGISSSDVRDAVEGSDGTIWVATAAGLDRLETSTRRFYNYGSGEGLFSGEVLALVADVRGNLWFSTDLGLYLYLPESDQFIPMNEGEFSSVTGFTINCGTLTEEGSVLFGGKGILGVDTGKIFSVPPVPRVLPGEITLIRKKGTEVLGYADLESYVRFSAENGTVPSRFKRKDYRVLNRGVEHLSIRMDQLDPIFRDLVETQCMMKGLDTHWFSGTEAIRGSWSEVPPGRYILEIRTSSRIGWWGDEGFQAVLPLRVKRHPAAQWWAIVLYVLILGGALGYGGWRGRELMKAWTGRLKREAESARSDVRKLEEEAQLRNRFVRSLLDGIGEEMVDVKHPVSVFQDAGNLFLYSSGEAVPSRETVFLHHAASEAAGKVEAGCTGTGCQVRNDIAPFLRPVTANEKIVVYVCEKLLSMVVHFSGSGSVRISAEDRGSHAEVLIQTQDAEIPDALFHNMESASLYPDPDLIWQWNGLSVALSSAQAALNCMGSQLIWEKNDSLGTILSFSLPISSDGGDTTRGTLDKDTILGDYEEDHEE